MPKKAPSYTTTDLAAYLRISRGRVIAMAETIVGVRWNKRRTRTKPFTELEAMAIIARTRLGKHYGKLGM